MSGVYEIPLTPATPQTLTAPLSGHDYRLLLTWNHQGEYWMLDLSTAGGVWILRSVPMLPGRNLLGGFEHLSVGGELWVRTDGDPDAAPTFDSLGVTTRLYFVVR